MPRSKAHQPPLASVRVRFLESLRFTVSSDDNAEIKIAKDTVLVGVRLGIPQDGEQEFLFHESFWMIDLALVDVQPIKEGEPTTIRDLANETLAQARAAAAEQKWREAIGFYHQAETQLAMIDAPKDEREQICVETIRVLNKRAAEKARTQDLDKRLAGLAMTDLAEVGATVVLLLEAIGVSYNIPTVEEGDTLLGLIRTTIQNQASNAAMRPHMEQILGKRGGRSANHNIDFSWPPTKDQQRQILARLADSLTYVEPTTPASQREAMGLLALQLNPDELDAYNILADLAEERGDLAEALRLAQEAIQRYHAEVQQRSKPTSLKDDSEGTMSWYELGNRPYLRALQRVGLYLKQIGQLKDATVVFKQMLELNPSDNQGIRYVLANVLLELGDDAGFEALQQQMWRPEQYPNADWESLRPDGEEDEEARLQWKAYQAFKRTKKPPTGAVLDLDIPGYTEDAGWKYPVALHRFRVEGDSPAAQAALQRAIVSNRHVSTFLSGRMALPAYQPQSYSNGSVEEAISYVREGREAWVLTPGAINWLAGQVAPAGRGRRRKDGMKPAEAARDSRFAAMAGLFPRAIEWQRDDAEATSIAFTSVRGFIDWALAYLDQESDPRRTSASDLTPDLIQAFLADPPRHLKLARDRAAIGRWLAWLYQKRYITQDLSPLFAH